VALPKLTAKELPEIRASGKFVSADTLHLDEGLCVLPVKIGVTLVAPGTYPSAGARKCAEY